MDIVIISIAIVSLIVSVMTFYFTQLQSSKLKVLHGDTILMYYYYYSTGGGFLGILVPSTFINTSHRTGIIFKCVLTLTKIDNPQDIYYIEWNSFHIRDSVNDKWVFDELSHPVIVAGRSSIYKTILYTWNSPPNPEFIIKEGTYDFSIYSWISYDKKPTIISRHRLHITKEHADKLLQYKEEKKSTTVKVILDKAIDENRLMTPYEIKTLLGQ